MNKIQLSQINARGHGASSAMDFFGLRYCLIMDPFVHPQRAVTGIPVMNVNVHCIRSSITTR